MAKTFTLQIVSTLQRVARYFGKHQAALQTNMSAGQYAALVTIISTIQTTFSAIPTRETP